MVHAENPGYRYMKMHARVCSCLCVESNYMCWIKASSQSPAGLAFSRVCDCVYPPSPGRCGEHTHTVATCPHAHFAGTLRADHARADSRGHWPTHNHACSLEQRSVLISASTRLTDNHMSNCDGGVMARCSEGRVGNMEGASEGWCSGSRCPFRRGGVNATA